MKKIFFILLILPYLSVQAQQQQVLITLDDLPFGYSGQLSEQEKIQAFENIITALKQ